MLISILIFLILLAYFPWIAIIVVYPWNVLAVYTWLHPQKRWARPLAIPYRMVARFTRSGWEKFCAVHIGHLPSYHLRKWMYKGLGVQCEENVIFRYGTEIWSAHHLHIGKGMIGGYDLLLDARNGIEIGANVNFSARVSIYTEQHDYRAADFGCDDSICKKVTLGNRVWVGPNVIILPGVTIGEGAVLAAGCVVAHDVPPFTVVAGIPAKKIAERPQHLTYQFNGKGGRLY